MSLVTAAGRPVDAVVGWWAFPTTGLVPVIRSLLGLPGPPPRAVAMLEHKYWSRLVQRAVVPDAVPHFTVRPRPRHLDIALPAWVKPIKSHSDSLEQLREVLPVIRARIGRLGRPFDQYLAHVERPPEVEPVTGHHCIVEELISAGDQCTLEGYVHPGQVHVEPEHHNWLVHRDLATDESVLEVIDDRGVKRLDDIGLTVGARARERYSSVGDDFSSIRGEARWERSLARGPWSIRTITRTVLASTPERLTIDADLDAYEGDRRVYCRTWHEAVPRDLL